VIVNINAKFFYFALLLNLVSCVSVKLSNVEAQKSRDAKYTAPNRLFHEVPTPHLDKKWANTSNGNIISFLSDCNNPTDPSLENIFKGLTSEVDNVQIIEAVSTQFNSRAALHSTVQGVVDGVGTRFELMIFKKNDCTYILTYAAAEKSYADNREDFNKFIKGFIVP